MTAKTTNAQLIGGVPMEQVIPAHSVNIQIVKGFEKSLTPSFPIVDLDSVFISCNFQLPRFFPNSS